MVGIIPEFRKLLIGEHAPLRVVEGSASLLGFERHTNTAVIDYWGHSNSVYCSTTTWGGHC